MKAIILASGPGERLMPLTKHTPKPLIKIGERAILGRIIDSLLENGIKDILITTGHLEEKIKEFMKKNYPQIRAEYIYNPLYQTTNYIYSLWLAKDLLKKSNIIYMHSDLFYDQRLIRRITNFKKSGVLVNKNLAPKKDFKARIKKGLVTEIGVNISGNNVCFCLPIFRYLKSDFGQWLAKIDEFVRDGKTDCYAEDAFNEISDQIELYPLYYDQEFGMEVDDADDLKKARKLLSSN